MYREKSRYKSPCQTPKAYDPKYLDEGEPIFISRKLNGVHGIFLEGKLITRERSEITGVQHIVNDCWLLSDALGGRPSSPWVIEGELLVEKNSEDEEDYITAKRTLDLLFEDLPAKPTVTFHVFDAVSLDEYYGFNSRGTRLYKARKTALINAFTAIQADLEATSLVEFMYEGFDHSEIERCFKLSAEKGWEGIIINRNLPYSRKTDRNVLKLKNIHTVDLPIVGFKRGTGIWRKTLGTLKVKYGDVIINVSHGFDYDTRDYIWTHQEEYKGRIAEIKYQSININAKGEKRIRYPIFVCIRPLGKEVNEGD